MVFESITIAHLIGGIIVFVAAVLGGIAGFGFALLCTPLLLIVGFPLSLIVPVNLSLALVSRISVAYRFRNHLNTRRVFLLVVSSFPGMYIGIWVLTLISSSILQAATGVVIMLAVLLMARTPQQETTKPLAGAVYIAGLLGGFLGATTSLNGIPPALLLVRDQTSPRQFQANLALFFVMSNAITLFFLTTQQQIDFFTILPIFMLWLPSVLLGSILGIVLSTRLSTTVFRRMVLVIAFVAGAITVLSSL
ncbi:MAG: sulfite exporter TauE/SafE family protein [Chloroflexota bacterium]